MTGSAESEIQRIDEKLFVTTFQDSRALLAKAAAKTTPRTKPCASSGETQASVPSTTLTLATTAIPSL